MLSKKSSEYRINSGGQDFFEMYKGVEKAFPGKP